jgi:hypothetical protein
MALNCPQIHGYKVNARIEVSPIDTNVPYPPKVTGMLNQWRVDGLTQATRDTVNTGRWLNFLHSKGQDIKLPKILVERTPRKGREKVFTRRPWIYSSYQCHDGILIFSNFEFFPVSK